MPATSAAASASTDGLSGRDDGSGRHGLPAAASAASAAANAGAVADARGRTRLVLTK